MTFQRYIGLITAIAPDNRGFNLRISQDREINVAMLGSLPPIVSEGATVAVTGKWSAPISENAGELFGATEVSALTEEEEDEIAPRWSFSEWQRRLREMQAGALDKFFQSTFESEKPYVGKINFLTAVMDRFFQLGYLSGVLSDEERLGCRDRAEKIAEMIRGIFRDDPETIRRFEQAYSYSKDELYRRFDSDALRKSGIPNVD
jgi:hypothetical protein